MSSILEYVEIITPSLYWSTWIYIWSVNKDRFWVHNPIPLVFSYMQGCQIDIVYGDEIHFFIASSMTTFISMVFLCNLDWHPLVLDCYCFFGGIAFATNKLGVFVSSINVWSPQSY